jgi:cytochrome c oxidase cbb3-type subunit 3
MNGGKKIFQSKCSTCHGMFGEGGIGPNLTDEYWLHGAQLMNIYATVRDGVPAKGMLSWERQLRPAELMAVSAYVGTLLGTDPPNQKDPQGERMARVAPAGTDNTEATEDEPTAEPAESPAES